MEPEQRDLFPVLAVLVPEVHEDWFREYPADMFFVCFEEIFKILRLWALHLAKAIGVDEVPNIAIADPYLLHEGNIKNDKDRATMEKYIAHFMLTNQDKHYLLMPYRP